MMFNIISPNASSVVMLSFMLNVIIFESHYAEVILLNVIMLNVIMLNVIMLNVIIPSVVLQNVVASLWSLDVDRIAAENYGITPPPSFFTTSAVIS